MAGKPTLPSRFELVRLLGEGGAGTVWLCHDTKSGNRQVAVKVAPSGHAASLALRHEYATLSNLRHPAVPAVHGFETLGDGACCFALEFIDGSTFTEAASSERSEFPRLAAEALHALSFIHEFGLLHRDLKPENLIVRRESRRGWRVALLDFGLAEKRRSAIGEVGGTLRYMAPELFQGAAPTVKSDLFSIGIMFHESLVGRHPIDVDPALDLTSYLQALQTPIKAAAIPPDLPAEAHDWLSSLCNYDPENRPSDAREALAELRGVFGTDVFFETPTARAALLASGDPPGRHLELQKIYDDLEGEDLTAFFLMGEAGSGKTRLLNAVRAQKVRDGWEVKSPHDVTIPSDDVRETASERRELILVDELENSSPEIAVLLDRLVRRPADGAIKILAAGRREEVRDPRIKSLLADSEFMPTASTLDLNPLDEHGVAAVLERASGGVAHERASLSGRLLCGLWVENNVV